MTRSHEQEKDTDERRQSTIFFLLRQAFLLITTNYFSLIPQEKTLTFTNTASLLVERV